MKISLVLLTSVFAFLLMSCENTKTSPTLSQSDSLRLVTMTMAQSVFQALPENCDNPNNISSSEKIALGKKLYNDVRLSKDNTISCNSCHNLATYGVDNNATSPGVNKVLGGRNSPTVLNAAFHSAQFWDGRMKDVEEQAGGPILNPVEMAIPNEAFLIKKLKGIPEYVQMFKTVYPDAKEPITYENLRLAIAAFERTLITPSIFDKFLKGDSMALNHQQIKGLSTFMRVGCQTCHSGSVLGGTMFQKFGVFTDYASLTKSAKIDSGKVIVTKNPEDVFVFKTMGLRNIEKTAPYFHDGSVKDLKEAIKIMGKAQLNKDLSQQELEDIYSFLQTLTGKVSDNSL